MLHIMGLLHKCNEPSRALYWQYSATVTLHLVQFYAEPAQCRLIDWCIGFYGHYEPEGPEWMWINATDEQFIWAAVAKTRNLLGRGGTNPPKNDKIFRKLKLTGIFRCSLMFKNRGKFWFLPKTSFDPPYGGSENLKIPIKNRNFKVVLP